MNSFMRRLKVPKVLTKALLLLLSVALIGLLLGDTFLVFDLIALVLICVIGLWSLGLALLFLRSQVNRGAVKPIKFPFLPWALATSLLLAFLGGGLVKRAWLWRQAQHFVIVAVQQLDLEKKQGRVYPPLLPPALQHQKPETLTYNSNGRYYFFSYQPQHYFLTSWHYDSDTRRWKFYAF